MHLNDKLMNKLNFFLYIISIPFFYLTYAQERIVPKNNHTYQNQLNSINIDETLTPEELIKDVLINSSCANVSNFSVSGGNFTTGEKSYGAFYANGTNFPFQEGIILTNGKASNASNPRTNNASSGDNSWLGDADLDQTLNISSKNATVIEFDFVPLGNSISFEYIFASEEYAPNTTYPCTYSDGFAFLLKEVNAPSYQNLALIPNTNIPVKVTTVHPNIPGNGGCGPANEQYFDAFNPNDYPTVYDGQTVILRAEAAVVPNTTYHIKLVIGDENDTQFDSAIFIAGGSFNIGKNLGPDRVVSNGNPICSNDSLNAFDVNATAYQWFFNNNPIIGETNPQLTFNPPFDNATQAGEYYVEISYGTTCTSVSNKIYIEFAEDLILNVNEYTKCDSDATQDGITEFTSSDFNTIKNQLFSNLPANYQIAFYPDANSLTPLAVPYTNTTPYQQLIYARISNLQSNCYTAYPINLFINTFNEPAIKNYNFLLCSDDESVTLNAASGYENYSWNTNPVSNEQSIVVNSAGTYVVTLTNDQNCTGIQTFTVVKSEKAIINNIITTDFNSLNTANIVVSGLGDYEYSLDSFYYQDESEFYNLEPGEYTVYVRDKNGCGISFSEFFILGAPTFFTPNNDGYNDTWLIKNLEHKSIQNYKISIFNRFGKLIAQLNEQNNSWDGNFNGFQLPSDDYWYLFESEKYTLKGHFSLKR